MTIIFLGIAIIAFLLLLFAPFSRSTLWRATITPIASIIGSGFLVSAPLLAREFGGYAALAMLALVILAWLLGGAIRYNIRVVEPALEQRRDVLLDSIEELSHLVLAFAYFISVAYYLSLLGNFLLQWLGRPNEALAQLIAIGLVVALAVLGVSGGAERVAKVERFATALNLAVIGGFLTALAVFDFGRFAAGAPVLPPAGRFSGSSLPILLGLLIVVQGFETTRFTGARFDGATRIRAMRMAQLISGAVYAVFFILLSPLIGELSQGHGVAAIISTSSVVAAILPTALAIAAMGSQFSASVADSLGNVGLIRDLSHGRILPRHGFLLVGLVGVGILMATDVNQIIALASRAFALFYAMQSLVAWEAARKRPADRRRSLGFLLLAIVAFAVFVFGIPTSG